MFGLPESSLTFLTLLVARSLTPVDHLAVAIHWGAPSGEEGDQMFVLLLVTAGWLLLSSL